jgi:hypothetical protein
MYTALLTVHSYLRWLVLIVAVVAIARAIAGVSSRRPWNAGDEGAAKWLVITLDIQLLIGLILYVFLSPFTMPAWRDIGAAMRDGATRLIVIEHPFGMLIALALAHIGKVRLRKTADLTRRHKIALVFFGLALVLMVASIPWPGRPGGRALFRGFGVE